MIKRPLASGEGVKGEGGAIKRLYI